MLPFIKCSTNFITNRLQQFCKNYGWHHSIKTDFSNLKVPQRPPNQAPSFTDELPGVSKHELSGPTSSVIARTHLS